eukprot:sb/3461297/
MKLPHHASAPVGASTNIESGRGLIRNIKVVERVSLGCGTLGNEITPPRERPGGREHVGVIISLVQREKNSFWSEKIPKDLNFMTIYGSTCYTVVVKHVRMCSRTVTFCKMQVLVTIQTSAIRFRLDLDHGIVTPICNIRGDFVTKEYASCEGDPRKKEYYIREKINQAFKNQAASNANKYKYIIHHNLYGGVRAIPHLILKKVGSDGVGGARQTTITFTAFSFPIAVPFGTNTQSHNTINAFHWQTLLARAHEGVAAHSNAFQVLVRLLSFPSLLPNLDYRVKSPIYGKWQHIALSWRSSDGLYQGYIDGERVLYNSKLSKGKTPKKKGNFVIGQFDRMALQILLSVFVVCSSQILHFPSPRSKSAGTFTEFSISGWIKPDSAISDHATSIVSYATNCFGCMKSMNYWYNADSFSGCIIFSRIHGAGTSGSTCSTMNSPIYGKWQHIALSWRSSDGLYQGYIDGERVLYNSKLSKGKTPKKKGNFVIGQGHGSLEGGFQSKESYVGDIKDLYFYSKALTSEQIKALYDGSASPETVVSDIFLSWETILKHGRNGAVTIVPERKIGFWAVNPLRTITIGRKEFPNFSIATWKNNFVAAVDYFKTQFDRSDMGFVVSATNSHTVCAAVLLNILLVNKIGTHQRILFGYLAFSISLGAMVAVLLLTQVTDLITADIGFIVTIAATIRWCGRRPLTKTETKRPRFVSTLFQLSIWNLIDIMEYNESFFCNPMVVAGVTSRTAVSMEVSSATSGLDKIDRPPRDRHNRYFIAFMILGAGFHLPFNSFVAAVDYFKTQFDRSDMGFVVSATNSHTVCAAVLLNILLVNKIGTHQRILFGYLAFSISLGAMVAVLLLTQVTDLITADIGFIVTIAATILTGLGCGVQEASYYGYAGTLPARYTRAVMLGEAFSGIIVSLNRIITKLTSQGTQMDTNIFFALSVLGEILCIFLHRHIRHSDFVGYYEDFTDLRSPTTTSVTPLIEKRTTSMWSSVKEGTRLRLSVSRKIWKLMLGIFNVYLVTNLVYPGLASVIPSSWDNNWFPVAMVTIFNVFDFVGTLVTGLSWVVSDRTLLLCGAVRWLLFPVLILSCLPMGNPLIAGEAIPMGVIAVIGFTTGYMGSIPINDSLLYKHAIKLDKIFYKNTIFQKHIHFVKHNP